jgi:GAF domain
MDDVCAELAVPVVVGDRLLGVLNVELTRPLSEEAAVDLESVADQLGVAIDNARLFARTQQTLAETQLLYETSRRMSTSMDVDEVIDAYLCTVMLYILDEAGQRTAAIIRGRWTPGKDGSTLKSAFPIRATPLILSSTPGRRRPSPISGAIRGSRQNYGASRAATSGRRGR